MEHISNDHMSWKAAEYTGNNEGEMNDAFVTGTKTALDAVRNYLTAKADMTNSNLVQITELKHYINQIDC